MITEREEALELAQEAVGTIGAPTFHTLHTWHETFWIELVRLAKQRGAEERKQYDLDICREYYSVECIAQNIAKAIEEHP